MPDPPAYRRFVNALSMVGGSCAGTGVQKALATQRIRENFQRTFQDACEEQRVAAGAVSPVLIFEKMHMACPIGVSCVAAFPYFVASSWATGRSRRCCRLCSRGRSRSRETFRVVAIASYK